MEKQRKEEMLKKFKEHLSNVDEVALVVLKGHLIIEESLGKIISKFVFHEDKIESARLSFAQKVWIARSMSLDETDNTMWELVLSINALRNDLAHNLKSKKREQKIDRVLALYKAEMKNGTDLSDFEEQHIQISFAISLCTGFLSSFEAEVDRFKDWINKFDRVVNPHRHE